MAASQGMFKVAHQTWCIDITSGCPDKICMYMYVRFFIFLTEINFKI